MHENMKTSMWHTGRSERTCRLPACYCVFLYLDSPNKW